MPISRIVYTVVACAAAVVLLAFTARAADAPAPVPVVKLTGGVTPSHKPIPAGMPLSVHLHMRFSSDPPGANFVLQGVDMQWPAAEARFNGALFPSCSARRLRAAHGSPRACPRGSQIGDGSAAGLAVKFGISGSGRLALFNGPGGKSFTVNFSVVHPVALNVTWSDPVAVVDGGHTILVRERDPIELQSILDSDIAVTRIDLNAGATRIVHGRRRGYFEARACGHGDELRTKYYFKGGATANAKVVTC
jgi:hypothetical protein